MTAGIPSAEGLSAELVADAVAYGVGAISEVERPLPADFRAGNCDAGDLIQRALACIKRDPSHAA